MCLRVQLYDIQYRAYLRISLCVRDAHTMDFPRRSVRLYIRALPTASAKEHVKQMMAAHFVAAGDRRAWCAGARGKHHAVSVVVRCNDALDSPSERIRASFFYQFAQTLYGR